MPTPPVCKTFQSNPFESISVVNILLQAYRISYIRNYVMHFLFDNIIKYKNGANQSIFIQPQCPISTSWSLQNKRSGHHKLNNRSQTSLKLLWQQFQGKVPRCIRQNMLPYVESDAIVRAWNYTPMRFWQKPAKLRCMVCDHRMWRVIQRPPLLGHSGIRKIRVYISRILSNPSHHI